MNQERGIYEGINYFYWEDDIEDFEAINYNLKKKAPLRRMYFISARKGDEIALFNSWDKFKPTDVMPKLKREIDK